MKRVLYAGVLAMGCTIALAAQGGAADQAKEKGKDADKAVTLTGCVAESGGQFMLNNATMSGGAGAPASYALSGGTLKPHVGHKVEITGAMKPAATTGKDSTKKDPMAKGDAKDAKKDDMATAGTVTVKDLKMVAPTCS
jgi:hypothetical protein